MSGLAARPEISITVPQTPSPANKTEDENEAALSEMAGLLVLWARARMREMHREEGMPDSIRRNRNRGRDAGKAQRERGGVQRSGTEGSGTERMRERGFLL